MAESYFKDPLLAKWASECWPSTLSYIEGESAYSEPLLILELLDGNTAHSIYDDRVKLRSLVSRELSGARRARDKAEEIANRRYPHAGPGLMIRNSTRTETAREILEEFDGE